MFDVDTESLVSLSAARSHPVFNSPNGNRASMEKMYRVSLRGARDVHGNLVRLEVVKLPAGFHTSKEAIRRFVARLSGEQPAPPSTSATRKRQIDKAEAELKADGFEIGQPATT